MSAVPDRYNGALRLVIAIALLAGCYEPRSLVCRYACATDQQCPTGLGCHGGICRESASDTCVEERDASTDAPLDDDRDGVPNAIDLCPQQSDPKNRDHDGDEVGDVCDPCPHLHEALQSSPDVDDDDDGVGNGCDPRPGMSDVRVRFVGFYDAGDMAGAAVEGSVIIVNGQARMTAVPGPARLTIPSADERAVEVRTLMQISYAADNGYAGVMLHRSTPAMHIECHLLVVQGANRSVRSRIDSATDSTLLYGGGPTIGTHELRAAFEPTTDMLDCHVGPTNNMRSAPDRSGAIVLDTSNTIVDYDYVDVIRTQ